MVALAALLIAVSIADWLYGDSAEQRVLFIFLIGLLAITAGTITYLAYPLWGTALLTASTLIVGVFAWTSFRTHASKRYRSVALAALAMMLAIGALVIPAFNPENVLQNSPLQQILTTFLGRLPWHTLARMNPELVLLTIGMLLFLGSTSNAVVRTVMSLIRSGQETTSIEHHHEAPEEQLKGGRYIGPLERWLIFGLALAGQPTAAALVISAKSIIRFPELQSKAVSRDSAGSPATDFHSPGVQRIDELTEYFLIGSLLSWLLALLAALPIVSLA